MIMLSIFDRIERIFEDIDRAVFAALLPTLARFIFAATLAVYYWKSAMTKIGDGLFSPSLGAYAQIFPKSMEAVGYNPAELTLFHTLIVIGATYGEFILPLLVVIGLLSRLAALGMIGFVFIQSIVDVYGHGLSGKDIGSWFDALPGSLILDQRAFWVFLLLLIVAKGAGPISLDRFLVRESASGKA